jgi:hypothetical protein
MSTTRTSSRRQRILPARYQDPDLPPSQPTTTTTTATAPRGRKRSRSTSVTSRPYKRTASEHTETQLESLQSDIALTLNASPSPTIPRITIPLNIDVTHVQLPAWIDMTTDHWTIWRHIYDKWQIQKKFAIIHSSISGQSQGVELAHQEIDRLLYIREKLLADHPDRQDIDLRNRKQVKQLWRYLSKVQLLGEEVAKFNCLRVAREMGWDVTSSEEDEDMWKQIGVYLIEQGVEGRIFIDPREYYDHYSWCVEDFGKEVSPKLLTGFYHKFVRTGGSTEECKREAIEECDDCSASTESCQCTNACLLCLPHTEGYVPISPISSLPSPPRTPGTQPLPSYFKGRRLSHPPPKVRDKYSDDDAVDILLSFSGQYTRPPNKRQGRSRHTQLD